MHRATVTVTVTGVNDAPDAVNDQAGTNADATSLIDVLANDTDVDGDDLTITAVTQPTQGIVTIDDKGTADVTDDEILFNPNGEFDGLNQGQTQVVTFTYTVSDGDLTDTATVEVTVTGVNDDPIAVTPPNFVELEVTETDPGLKGDTAQGATKPATVSTGATVKVPLFVNQGDVLKIDTRTGEYINRVK